MLGIVVGTEINRFAPDLRFAPLRYAGQRFGLAWGQLFESLLAHEH